MTHLIKAIRSIGIACLGTQSLFGDLVSETPSIKNYQTGNQKLTVYTDVPGWNTSGNKIKSDIYTIRVRSAASSYAGAPNDGWVECFPHYTYNRALELQEIAPFKDTTTQNYLKHTAGWSQTYANIEMTPNTTVEVEIGRIGDLEIVGSRTIFKSAVHPVQKVSFQETRNGKAYFEFTNPGQIVIDINGQMDDHNAVINPLPGSPAVHTVTLFANPIMVKPALSGPGVLSIAPSAVHPTTNLNHDPSTYTTIVFQPGVHRIGQHFYLHPGKTYYIPGDAIVFGTLNNNGSGGTGYNSNGDSITLHGYGTLSGMEFPHYEYRYAYNKLPPMGKLGDRAIVVENAVNFEINGLTIADPSNFSVDVTRWSRRDPLVVNDAVRWSKAITWRANGDGYGGVDLIEDCFLRTNDDSNYVKGSRRRLTTWKDGAAQMFRVPQLPVAGTRFPYVIEDCDVIYNRTRDRSPTGHVSHVFDFEAEGLPGVIATDLTIRNIRLHDRRGNMRLFNFRGNKSYTGIRIENIAAKKHTNGRPSCLEGTAGSIWDGWPIFKNITFDDGTNNVLLTAENFGTYFETNGFALNLQVEAPPTVTVSATDASAAEPGNNGTFTFTRSGSTGGALTANFTLGGTATSGSDYESLGTSVTFAAGQGSVTKTVAVTNDTAVESSETVVATLAGGAEYVVGTPGSATVNLADDDVFIVTVSATDASAAEPGNNGTLTFARSGGTSDALTLNFTVGGTATSGSDYQSLGTSVTFAAGQGSVTTTVAVTNDTAVESSETVVATLVSGAGYTIGSPGSATINLADDDVFGVTVSATDANAEEPVDNGTFTFTRSGGTSGALTVNFTVGGTATSGSDYQNLGTSVILADGQTSATKTVSVTNDTAVEGSETVVVTLSSGAGYSIGSPGSDTVNITDDDLIGEAVPWMVNFDGLAQGGTNQEAPASWTATRSGGGTFQVSSNRLEINGAGDEGVLTSGVMDISGGNVNLSLDLLSVGPLESGTGSAQDYFRLYTKINGGAETLVRQVLGNQAATTWSATNLSGNTLQIIIKAKVTAADEFYQLDNLSITDVALPSPWQTADIGIVGISGVARAKEANWTILGSGADIWSKADGFRYVYQSSSGDCSMVARVGGLTNTDVWAKSSLMIRESTAANAINAMVCVTPFKGVSFQWRSTTGAGTNIATVTGQTAPKWLKITRIGSMFSGFYSSDGTTWMPIGTEKEIAMAATATLGMAVTSHKDGVLCISTVDNVTATP